MSHEVFLVPLEPLHVIVTFGELNTPGPIYLGVDVDEQLALVMDHSTGEVYSKKLRALLWLKGCLQVDTWRWVSARQHS